MKMIRKTIHSYFKVHLVPNGYSLIPRGLFDETVEDYERAPAEAYINLTDLAAYLNGRLQINTIEIIVSEQAGTHAVHVYCNGSGHYLTTDPVRRRKSRESILTNPIFVTKTGAHYYWLRPKVDSETREDGEDGDEEDDEDE